MNILRGRRLIAIIAAISIIGLFSAMPSVVSASSPGDVVINELMYNPGTGNQLDEFLELYNTTGSPVDISGWSFTSGIVLTFPPGTNIPANGYMVISPSIAQTLSTYFVVSSFNYTGNLSNGGETVTLVDGSLTEMDTVNYDDISPWPTAPDGNGHSLELKDPSLDNNVASNWSASLFNNGGTPLAQNSIFGLGLPVVSGVNDPNDIVAGQDVNITATVSGVGLSSVDLKYKLNFDADITLTMYDDGAHNDGAASDNVYGATIPGQPINTLVRFRVEATNPSGVGSSPDTNDSMDYAGYTVHDPSITTPLPIIMWYMDTSTYADMIANHNLDNAYIGCVVAIGNDVFDNSQVRVKGDASRYDDKKSYKFKLPGGYTVGSVDGTGLQVSEFHIDAQPQSSTQAEDPTSWWAIGQAGLPTPNHTVARVQQNGEFYGVYMFSDKYEKEWRQNNGYSTGDLYEDFVQPVSGPGDVSARDAWRDSLMVYRKDPAELDTILDTVDLPAMFNYMSIDGLLSCYDHFTAWNSYLYKDSGDTDRWSQLMWDLDSCFYAPAKGGFETPYDWLVYPENKSFLNTSIYSQPSLRPLFYRRLKTLIDKLYTNDAILNKFRENYAITEPDMQLDIAKWGGSRYSSSDIEGFIANIKRSLLLHLKQSWLFPDSQTDSERQQVSISEVHADGIDAEEYIKLSNSSSTPVDISNWYIEGIDYTIPAGSVVPAGGSIYLLRSDVGYRGTHDPVLVAGQYNNDLGSFGTLILNTDTGAQIDTYDY